MLKATISPITNFYLQSSMRRFLLLAILAGISLPLIACTSNKKISREPVVVETLISATKSWNGDSFQYPKGKAEMTLQKITTQPGFKTPFHLHPQPGIVYVLRGTLYCETSDGKSLKVGPEESFASSQDTVHYCENNSNEEGIFLVTSAGVQGQNTTVSTK